MTWMGFIRDFYKEQTMKKLVIEHLKKTFDQNNDMEIKKTDSNKE